MNGFQSGLLTYVLVEVAIAIPLALIFLYAIAAKEKS